MSKKNTGENIHGVTHFHFSVVPFPPNLSKCHLCIELGSVKQINELQIGFGCGLCPTETNSWYAKLENIGSPFHFYCLQWWNDVAKCIAEFSVGFFLHWWQLWSGKPKQFIIIKRKRKQKKQASRQFDLVLQPVGVGPFLPKCILPFLGLSYSVHVPFHRSTCEGTEWADIELMPWLCTWEEAVMLDFLAGSTFLWQSLTCTQHLMASWEAAQIFWLHTPSALTSPCLLPAGLKA